MATDWWPVDSLQYESNSIYSASTSFISTFCLELHILWWSNVLLHAFIYSRLDNNSLSPGVLNAGFGLHVFFFFPSVMMVNVSDYVIVWINACLDLAEKHDSTLVASQSELAVFHAGPVLDCFDWGGSKKCWLVTNCYCVEEDIFYDANPDISIGDWLWFHRQSSYAKKQFLWPTNYWSLLTYFLLISFLGLGLGASGHVTNGGSVKRVLKAPQNTLKFEIM